MPQGFSYKFKTPWSKEEFTLSYPKMPSPEVLKNDVMTFVASGRGEYERFLKEQQKPHGTTGTWMNTIPFDQAYRPKWRKPDGKTGKRNIEIGKQIAAQYGWDKGPEWDSLVDLWTRESGWDHNAANKVTSARGIAQTMMSLHFGKNWKNNPKAAAFLADPAAQIKWGLGYIQRRYKTPSAALRWWMSDKPKGLPPGHWY